MMFQHRPEPDPIHPLLNLVQVNEPSGRYYFAQSDPATKMYSVTTILDAMMSEGKRNALTAWKNRVGEEQARQIRDAAAARGTAVHEMIEKYLCNDEAYKTAAPLARAFFANIRQELDEHLNNIVLLERALYSQDMRVAGTVDCIAEWDGQLSVIDFKTSGRPKRETEDYSRQLGAYALLFEELYATPIDKGVILIALDHPVRKQVFQFDENEMQQAKEEIKDLARRFYRAL